MNDQECHCGAFWFPKFVKRWLSKSFNDACAWHDRGYAEQTFIKAYYDDRFLGLMLDASKNSLDVFFAFAFYYSVVFFGFISWNRNKIRKHFKRS